MDSDKFGVVVFTLLGLLLIYLDNNGRLGRAIAAANGITTNGQSANTSSIFSANGGVRSVAA